ncbi:MAG: hypothetical protein QF535_08990, partial [Anaerolineales bacterium]|nr:hypothetical protein [Anaerolineales bacterium]
QGDIMNIAVDVDNGKCWFGINGTWNGSGDPAAGTNATFTNANITSCIASARPRSSTVVWNFGQDSSFAGNKTAQGNQDDNDKGDFYYAPPTGFLALCTANLPDPSIALPGENFNTVLWDGDGTSPRSISGVGFSPDLVWGKARDDTWGHKWQDVVRGSENTIWSNNTNAEDDYYIWGYLSAFDSDGFTITAGASGSQGWNDSTDTFVAWNWKAGTAFDPATAGTVVTGSGSANATAGFSIIKYTGTTSNVTVGHGLSAAPELVIIKGLDSTLNWFVNDPTATPFTKYLKLDANSSSGSSSTMYQDTAPNASVVTLGTSGLVNAAEDFIMYCFHSVEGYSKVGSWVATGSDPGPFFYCGFKPAFVMVKNVSRTNSNWWIMDNKRSTYNMDAKVLFPNTNAAEASGRSECDFLSNGIKFRGVVNPESNYSTDTYLTYAVAESPFKTSNAR